jgi:ATP-grasp domain
MSESRVPRILLTDTTRWSASPRLAIAFSRAGCHVAALCPMPGHPVLKTTGLKRAFPYSGYYPVASLRKAIVEYRPDIVIPACDRAVRHLHDLYTSVSSEGTDPKWIAALIERSLGSAESFAVVSSRFELLRVARAEGIPVPDVVDVKDLSASGDGRFQCVAIKADGTSGGRGVRFARSAQDASRSLAELASHGSYLALAKRMLLNRDRGWTFFDWKHSQRPVIVQRFVEGRPANCGVACWKGEVLAVIAVEVVLTDGETGPAIVVQIVEGAAMTSAAARLARTLNLSGFFGLDFMIEEPGGQTYLVELNARSTPPCALPLGRGRDLVTAVVAQLTGSHVAEREPVTEKNLIAYFPQGRNIVNGSVKAEKDAFYLDVPVGEEKLIYALMHPWPERGILGRLLDKSRKLLKCEHAVTACEFMRPVSQSRRSAEVPF